MPVHTFKSRFTTNFEYIKANSAKTNNFTVLYLHGLCSNPWGRKPESIKSFCIEKGLGFARFEMAGHGSDVENYAKSDINVWKSQMLEMIDDIISEPVLLVGMSVGGWLALLGGVLRPRRVVGIVGISAAPDFTIGLEEEYMSIYLLDAWDITKRPRDENEYDSKVEPLFNKVYQICKDLNTTIEKNPTFKQFKFDTDGDWDSISIDIRRR